MSGEEVARHERTRSHTKVVLKDYTSDSGVGDNGDEEISQLSWFYSGHSLDMETEGIKNSCVKQNAYSCAPLNDCPALRRIRFMMMFLRSQLRSQNDGLNQGISLSDDRFPALGTDFCFMTIKNS